MSLPKPYFENDLATLFSGDGARALVARMFDAFNDAKATVEQSGGWGLWRNHMTERFGAWSSSKRRQRS